ncbi:hypothetical protein LEP1GSC185_1913 [Leptospira licerasiae serovar Varillal str. VAR 010]|uniref:DUF1564 family protein n=1 Tax=Leptospira licerasiae str. MMD4847 TaxID=1049971 RepID=A0ABN0H633_9LEPT|nr:hypothetical protein LEP1GSC185_1913 [Leptospira licerasiae serovar Varillal str. VAR 010]EJZ41049.1 hypothetical protein LEP1GSC178_1179 [Leptospira licerasiae str. MMD4847]
MQFEIPRYEAQVRNIDFRVYFYLKIQFRNEYSRNRIYRMTRLKYKEEIFELKPLLAYSV